MLNQGGQQQKHGEKEAPNSCGGGGSTASQLSHPAAIAVDNVEYSEVLVSSGEDMNERAAAAAAKHAEVTRNWEMIEVMLENNGEGLLEGLSFVRDPRARKEVLIEAVKKDLPCLVKFILKTNRGLLHSNVDENRNSLLYVAAVLNSARVMKVLTEMNHSVNTGNSEIVKKHLQVAADECKLKTSQGETKTATNISMCGIERASLMESFKDHLEIVKELIQKGQNQNVKGGKEERKTKKLSFSWASLEGHLDVLKMLTENQDETTLDDPCLTLAALKGHMEVVKLLIRTGGNLNMRDEDGQTAMTWAAGQGHVDIVKMLLENEVDVKEENKSDATAMKLATRKGDLAFLKLLLEARKESKAKEEFFFSVLELATTEGHLKVVKFLLENGCDVNLTDNFGNSALMLAARTGKLDVVKFLVENGSDVNLKSRFGETALRLAAFEGHLDVLKYLIENGSHDNFVTQDGGTVLMDAVEEGHLEVVKCLIHKVCDVNRKDNFGYTAFLLAACSGHLEVLKFLVESGAETNVVNGNDENALMLAARGGHLNVVKFLLESGFDVNSKSYTGCSACMLAARNGHLEVVKLLFKNGCDVNIRAREDTALSLATWYGHTEVANFLRSVAKPLR